MLELLKRLVDLASPEVRDMLQKFLVDLKVKAEATPNIWDDVIVYALTKILGF